MRFASTGLVAATLVACGCGGAKPEIAASPPPSRPVTCTRQHPGVGPVRVGSLRQGATVALAHLGPTTLAYVADEDANALRTMDVDRAEERAVTPLDGTPAQVMVLADGRVAVTLRDKNRVQILEPAGPPETPLEARCSAAVPAEPVGLAETPDDTTLLVTSAWAKKLTALDAATLQTKFDVAVPREPRAVIVDDDGRRAFVAHVVGATLSVVDLGDAKHDVRGVDLRVRKVPGDGKKRGGCQGFALAKSVEQAPAVTDAPPVGERPMVLSPAPRPAKVAPPPKAPIAPRARVFAPMVTVDPGEPLVRSTGYGSPVASQAAEMPIVSVVDGAAERAMTQALLHDGQRHEGECILPRSAAVNAAGSALFVTCLGVDMLVELDTRGLDPARLERRRWAVPSGPTGVAIDDAHDRAVVWSQFDRRLAIVDLSQASGGDAVKQVSAPAVDVPARILVGRQLFHVTDDARISRDGRACASCHPDGREDALTWATPDGPRQTIMLAGRVKTSAPYGWIGAHLSLKSHVDLTFKRLGGAGLGGPAMESLMAYVEEMKGPSLDGAAIDPGKPALAARGKELFFAEQQGCATCHVGGPGTDQATHDVGSSQTVDRGVPFDTPALRFVAGTAPYFHDGRYATLADLLSSSDGKMGHTLQLRRSDVAALEAYLETL